MSDANSMEHGTTKTDAEIDAEIRSVVDAQNRMHRILTDLEKKLGTSIAWVRVDLNLTVEIEMAEIK